jgi:hypothetical protein
MLLYKYLHPDRVSILKERQIRFTQPGDFNDLFEFRPGIQSAMHNKEMHNYVAANFEPLLDDELAKNGALLEFMPIQAWKQLFLAQKSRLPELIEMLQPAMLNRVSAFINKFLNESVGVLCLSEVRDSLLMWAHYADNHRGLAIGFDSNHHFFARQRNATDEFGFLRKVDYRRKRPSAVLSDTSSTVWFGTKSEQWAYEKEWRIVRVLADANQRIDSQPFPICLFEFPSDALKEIILGVKAAPSLVEKVISYAKSFPNVKLLRAREHSDDYELIIEQDN